MNKDLAVEKMIEEVEIIEKETLVEKYLSEKASKKDAVSRIYKKLQEVVTDED